MVFYKKTTYREPLTGEVKGEIVAVEAVLNTGNPEWPNWTPEVLEISFQLEDPETNEALMYTQKFVAPLTEGKGLYSQLMEIKGVAVAGEGDYDEQQFVGMKLLVTMGKRLAKNGNEYPNVVSVKADSDAKPAVKKTAKKTEDDTPAFLKK